MGIPWRVAFALQADDWILRSDIVWAKPNALPESVRDRPTRSHEYVFLFANWPRYHYNQQAIREPVTGRAHPRGRGVTPKSVAPGAGRPGERQLPRGGHQAGDEPECPHRLDRRGAVPLG